MIWLERWLVGGWVGWLVDLIVGWFIGWNFSNEQQFNDFIPKLCTYNMYVWCIIQIWYSYVSPKKEKEKKLKIIIGVYTSRNTHFPFFRTRVVGVIALEPLLLTPTWVSSRYIRSRLHNTAAVLFFLLFFLLALFLLQLIAAVCVLSCIVRYTEAQPNSYIPPTYERSASPFCSVHRTRYH